MPFQPLSGPSSFSVPPIQGAPAPVDPLSGLSQIMRLASMSSMFENRALQQQMNLMRMQMWQQQAENGRTKAEQDRILKERSLQEYATRLVSNDEFRKRYHEIRQMSPGRQEKAFQQLKKDFIEPLRYHFNPEYVTPEKVYNYLFYDKIQEAKNKAAEIDKDYWSAMGGNIKTAFKNAAAGLSGLFSGASMLDIAKEVAANQQANVAEHPYLQDQELRRSQGDSLVDQPMSDIAHAALSELPTVGAYIGASLAGAGLGAIGGPAGVTAGTFAGPAALSAYLGDLGFAQQANTLPADQAQDTMDSPERLANIGINAALGVLPVGLARNLSRIIPASSLLGRAVQYGASPATGRFGSVLQHTLDSALGGAVMGAGAGVANNMLFGSASGQDIAWDQGLQDSALMGALLGGPFGAFIGARAPLAEPPAPTPPTGQNQTPPPQPQNQPPQNPQARSRSRTPNQTPPQNPQALPQPQNPQAQAQNQTPPPQPQPQQPQNQTPQPNVPPVNSKRTAPPTGDALVRYVQTLRDEGKSVEEIQTSVTTDLWGNDTFNNGDINVSDGLYPAKEITDKTIIDTANKTVTQATKLKNSGQRDKKFKTFLGKSKKFADLRDRRALLDRIVDEDTTLEPEAKAALHDEIADAYTSLAQNNASYKTAAALHKILYENPSEPAGESMVPDAELASLIQEYGEGANGKSQSQGTDTAAVNNNPADSGLTAGAPADASVTPDGTAQEAGGGGSTAASGVVDGAAAQVNRTPEAPAGTAEGAGTPAGEGQAGRAGEAASERAPADASAGSPNARAGERTGGAEPIPPAGGTVADMIRNHPEYDSITLAEEIIRSKKGVQSKLGKAADVLYQMVESEYNKNKSPNSALFEKLSDAQKIDLISRAVDEFQFIKFEEARNVREYINQSRRHFTDDVIADNVLNHVAEHPEELTTATRSPTEAEKVLAEFDKALSEAETPEAAEEIIKAYTSTVPSSLYKIAERIYNENKKASDKPFAELPHEQKNAALQQTIQYVQDWLHQGSVLRMRQNKEALNDAADDLSKKSKKFGKKLNEDRFTTILHVKEGVIENILNTTNEPIIPDKARLQELLQRSDASSHELAKEILAQNVSNPQGIDQNIYSRLLNTVHTVAKDLYESTRKSNSRHFDKLSMNNKLALYEQVIDRLKSYDTANDAVINNPTVPPC